MNNQRAFEEFIQALQNAPAGGDKSIEFLINSMEPQHGKLLRLCSIPHLFNPAILQVLDTNLSGDEAKDVCDNFAELSIVIPSEGEMQLHDNAREYLFKGWLTPTQADSFSRISARLKEYYERIAISANGAEKITATHQAIFHYVGMDKQSGFSAFEKSYRAARYRFALHECEALINLVHEYDPILDPSQKQWLAYHEGKLNIAFREWKKAENLFKSILDAKTSPELRSRTQFRLGMLYSAQRQWEPAIDSYAQALNTVKMNPEVQDQEHRILEGLAIAYREKQDLNQAKELINESINLALKNQDLSALAASYNSLGILHRMRGDAKPAIEYFKKSLEYLMEFKEEFRKAQLYNNLGLAYADLAQWEESRKYLESSLELERKAGDTSGQAKALANLGRVYLSQGEEDRSFRVAEESVGLSIQIHDWYHAAIVKRAEARVLTRLNRIDEAQKCYGEAIALFKKGKDIEEAETTEEELEKLGKKKKLPWYAWGVIVIASLAFILILIGLIAGIGQEL